MNRPVMLDCEQGSVEWLAARLGKPTSSCFAKLLTPGGKISTQAEGYLHALVAERLIGQPCVNDADTLWMQRGTETEDEARRWYAFQRDVEPRRVGFVLRGDGLVGCSPDSMVGDDGVLEIKVPTAANHVGYLLHDISDRYKPQIQGQLWITGRRYVDVLSYSPGMPAPLNSALVRVERDEAYIATLASVVDTFCVKVDEAYRVLLARVTEEAA